MYYIHQTHFPLGVLEGVWVRDNASIEPKQALRCNIPALRLGDTHILHFHPCIAPRYDSLIPRLISSFRKRAWVRGHRYEAK